MRNASVVERTAIPRRDARQLIGEGQASQVTPLDPLSSPL
jgi:hypothetical protein